MKQSWYSIVTADPSRLDDALADFENIVAEGLITSSDVKGKNLAQFCAQISSFMAYYYTCLQEIDAILEYNEITLDKIKAEAITHILKTNKYALSFTATEKLACGETSVYTTAYTISKIKLVRNKMIGVVKSFETLHFQLSNITKLRAGGVEDATL